MPKPSKFSLKGKKKQVLIAGGVVLLVAAAGGAGVLMQWLQHKAPSNPAAATATDTLPDAVQKARDLAAAKNFSESNKQLSAGIAATSNNDEKFELYLQQGVNAENQKKYDDALTSYKNAEAIKQTWPLYVSLGRTSEEKGDKAAALSYYKKALPLIPSDDPLITADTNELKAKITELGG